MVYLSSRLVPTAPYHSEPRQCWPPVARNPIAISINLKAHLRGQVATKNGGRADLRRSVTIRVCASRRHGVSIVLVGRPRPGAPRLVLVSGRGQVQPRQVLQVLRDGIHVLGQNVRLDDEVVERIGAPAAAGHPAAHRSQLALSALPLGRRHLGLLLQRRHRLDLRRHLRLHQQPPAVI